MSDITKPTPVAIAEKDPIIEEQERILLVDFTKACISGNLSEVKKQLNTKKIRDIIVSKENNFYITEALNIVCKNNQGKFVEDFIFNGEIMGLLGNITRPQILKQACENGHTELVKLLTSKKYILYELDVDTIEYVYFFSTHNGHIDIIKELLNNKDIAFKIFNNKDRDPSSEIIDAAILNENMNPETRKNMIMLILDDYEKKQLINKDILNKLFQSVCFYGYEEIFNKLLTDEKLKNKLSVDGAYGAILNSYTYNRVNFFKKILDNDLLRPKLIENYKNSMENFFINACKDNKQEIINILIADEEIKNKILPNTFYKICEKGNSKAFEILININGMLDKIKSSGSNVIQGCFQIACLNGKTNIINRLLNNQNIKSEIQPEVIENCFKEACDNRKTNVINALIDNTNASINFNLKEQAVRECFTKACDSGKTNIALELIENPKTKDIIFGNGNNITLNNFFNSLSQKKDKLGWEDMRLSLLVVRAKENDVVETNVYKSDIKNIINGLIEKLKLNKKEFEKIKDKNWNNKSNYEKTLLSLEKINKELLINKQKGIN